MSVVEQVRQELITLARRRVPVDNVVDFIEQNSARTPQAEIDEDVTALIRVYELPVDAWNRLCLRAAVSGVPVSDYVRHEIIVLSRQVTLDDVMLEFVEAQDADPSLDIDIEAVLAATRYARALD
ncbi:hypothetical protein [Nocardia arthritidis]|uniref:Uncharacterized protein n=1 Tax=Nocardia arthritidis TaxID=228602 RepID=A0A6G9YK67_9NOCA|nr:hypothetical protein [Nocardia arthritidis]QIS13594.1 hypothetical protein F5544_28715 [Nocardia arthritidis]